MPISPHASRDGSRRVWAVKRAHFETLVFETLRMRKFLSEANKRERSS
jgi:hypothetical protein